ncbi:cell wall-binding repeat-containing protein, partial [Mobiluncus mulieris]
GVLMMNFGKKMAVGVASAALVASLAGVPAAVAAGAERITFPEGGSFERIAGDSRVDTAIAAAERLYADKGKSLTKAYLVAAGDSHLVDAATSGMLTDGVVLLVPTDRSGQLLLGAAIKSKFDKVNTLVAVGGKNAVPDEAVAAVKKMNDKITKTERLDGKNRYETNVAVAKAAYKDFKNASRVYFTRGDVMVDALTAGAAGDGPVLMLTPSGDIDKATKDYYAEAVKHARDAVILGGEKALPSEQVAKVGAEIKKLDPWSWLKSGKELKANVALAAATYFGQSDWQSRKFVKDSMPPQDQGAAFDVNKFEKYDFFGLNGGSVKAESKDPSSVNIETAVSDPKKAFVGYVQPLKDLKANNVVITKQYNDLNAVKDNALVDAKTAEVKAAALSAVTNVNAGDVAAKLVKAVQDLYGLSLSEIRPTLNDSGAVSTSGVFKFDDDSNLTGLDMDKLDGVQSKLAAGDWSGKKVYKVGDTDLTFKEAVYAKIANKDAVLPGKDLAGVEALASGKVNWSAFYNVTKTELDNQQKRHDEAKQNLLDAVNAYYNNTNMELLTGVTGVPRLAGKSRYETSSLLAVYLEKRGRFVNSGSKDFKKDSRAYLASGDDAHLVDSVVAGQLTDGPILLVPASGEIDKTVLNHLAYLKKKEPNLGTFALGGKMSISEEIRAAAVKALKEAKNYKGTNNFRGNDDAGNQAPSLGGYASLEITNVGNAGAKTAAMSIAANNGRVAGLSALFDGLPKGVTATGNNTTGQLTFTPADRKEDVAANGTYKVTVRWIDSKGNIKYQDSVDVTVKLAAAPTTSAKPTLGAVTGSPITAANGTASVPVTDAKSAPAEYTCTIDKNELPATTGKVKFAVAWDSSAKACKVTATDDSHNGAVSGTIKVTVKVDEDGAGAAKTVSDGADKNVTVNIS